MIEFISDTLSPYALSKWILLEKYVTESVTIIIMIILFWGFTNQDLFHEMNE